MHMHRKGAPGLGRHPALHLSAVAYIAPHLFVRITMSGLSSIHSTQYLDEMEHTYHPNEIRCAYLAAQQQYWDAYQLTMPQQDYPYSGKNNFALAGAVPPTAQHDVNPRARSAPLVRLQPLPQELYGDSKKQDLSKHDVYFQTPGCPGISLADALRGHVDRLIWRDAPAFSKEADVSSKISVRIQFEGHQPYYHRQVMALRSTSSAEGISIGKLAQKIAEETKTYLVEEIQIDGHSFSFEDIFLYRLRRATKGSWQPEFIVCCA
ncbi:hypothetical protein BC628DRAFT_730118 [Trametes gibbosa]|nr:hypothetical protein BC628DRAFT_730118 [Trametes gibbosa]